MIENLKNYFNEQFTTSYKDFLFDCAKTNGKFLGDLSEMILPRIFKMAGKSSKILVGRNQEYDIVIENKLYSLKSSTQKEMQLSTLSDPHKNRIIFEDDILNKDLTVDYIKNLLETYGLEDFIFLFYNEEKNEITIGLFSINNFLKLIDDVKITKKKTHSPLCLYHCNNLIAEIKDDTGKKKANAFQRGLWVKDISLFLETDIVYDKFVLTQD